MCRVFYFINLYAQYMQNWQGESGRRFEARGLDKIIRNTETVLTAVVALRYHVFCIILDDPN